MYILKSGCDSDDFIPFWIAIGILLILYFVGRRKQKKLTEQLNHTIKENQSLQAKIKNLDNPHSFRNTLNTIQHLAKSTLNSVESLAGIFDYMLYDAQQKFVSLEKEIKFANEYFLLYKLRLSPTLDLKVHLYDPTFADYSSNDFLTHNKQKKLPEWTE